ncbi:response regulator transcription factor [Bacillus sp. FJAT-50079]|uniref:response regulator transcription factor n=1 Tax=Bacillus sp. FJAT-50079 TaxID=2833577 RepID=UPI001BC99F86|nr:response regulator transcription factor [Bacillus sp. FJAT-50079]MBS4208330.1 response regulator transcription factor [Bacillus sp. FJAT-50079]
MTKGKVLVVDDEYKIRSLLTLYLLEHEYEVITAGNGKEALSLIEQQNPDIVVLDIILPDISGLNLCKHIRKYKEIPVIYLSCLQESETIITGLEYGGDDYLTKPFDPNVLIARINALLRRARGKGLLKKNEEQMESLTSQEKLILQWIEKGYTNKEIAQKLKLKEGTIKVYNHTIFQKLQVKNRTQAIVRAKEEKII